MSKPVIEATPNGPYVVSNPHYRQELERRGDLDQADYSVLPLWAFGKQALL